MLQLIVYIFVVVFFFCIVNIFCFDLNLGGGTGFIGTRLTNLLRGKGYGVTVISRMPGLDRITWLDVEKNGLPKSKFLFFVIER